MLLEKLTKREMKEGVLVLSVIFIDDFSGDRQQGKQAPEMM